MNTKERREAIIKMLLTSTEPVTGTELAKSFEVSRQVIVQDIAVLRASGYNVIAASNGYFVPKIDSNRIIKTIISDHLEVENSQANPPSS